MPPAFLTAAVDAPPLPTRWPARHRAQRERCSFCRFRISGPGPVFCKEQLYGPRPARSASGNKPVDRTSCEPSWMTSSMSWGLLKNQYSLMAWSSAAYRQQALLSVSVRLTGRWFFQCACASQLTPTTIPMPMASQAICAAVSCIEARFCSCGIRSARATYMKLLAARIRKNGR